MGVEIERKFLIDEALLDRTHIRGTRLRQGYLATAPVVRVRLSEDAAWLTIKSASHGISRSEFEYPLPLSDARELLSLCGALVLDKTRFSVEFAGHRWDVDEFHGANEGLVTAEIELEDETESFHRPAWLGLEVSGDPRFANSMLARSPFRTWPENLS